MMDQHLYLEVLSDKMRRVTSFYLILKLSLLRVLLRVTSFHTCKGTLSAHFVETDNIVSLLSIEVFL